MVFKVRIDNIAFQEKAAAVNAGVSGIDGAIVDQRAKLCVRQVHSDRAVGGDLSIVDGNAVVSMDYYSGKEIGHDAAGGLNRHIVLAGGPIRIEAYPVAISVEVARNDHIHTVRSAI